MSNDPALSIIIVNYNVCSYLMQCLHSISEDASGYDYEIIVMDNASRDDSVEMVSRTFPKVRLIANQINLGFARAVNQGYAVSKGEYLLLLNPDTVVKSGAITKVLDFMKATPDSGLAACRLLNPDGSLQKSIGRFPTLGLNLVKVVFGDRLVFSHHRAGTYFRPHPFPIDYARGAFLMVRRAALGSGPLLDPRFFMYSEDVDLALRLRQKGNAAYFVPYAEVVHYAEQSANQAPVEMFLELQKSQIRLYRKFYSGLGLQAMIWSNWLHLLMSCLASLIFVFSDYGRYRLGLFLKAVWVYPRLVLQSQG